MPELCSSSWNSQSLNDFVRTTEPPSYRPRLSSGSTSGPPRVQRDFVGGLTIFTRDARRLSTRKSWFKVKGEWQCSVKDEQQGAARRQAERDRGGGDDGVEPLRNSISFLFRYLRVQSNYPLTFPDIIEPRRLESSLLVVTNVASGWVTLNTKSPRGSLPGSSSLDRVESNCFCPGETLRSFLDSFARACPTGVQPPGENTWLERVTWKLRFAKLFWSTRISFSWNCFARWNSFKKINRECGMYPLAGCVRLFGCFRAIAWRYWTRENLERKFRNRFVRSFISLSLFLCSETNRSQRVLPWYHLAATES